MLRKLHWIVRKVSFLRKRESKSVKIRENNIKQKLLRVYSFLVKRKKLFRQPNTLH